jgi:hypothetical protein
VGGGGVRWLELEVFEMLMVLKRLSELGGVQHFSDSRRCAR